MANTNNLHSFSLILSFSLLFNLTISHKSECIGRWIYIRNLPPRFNLDLIRNCSAYPIYDDFCPHIAHHGLGQKTHNKSQSWYRTDPHMLELIFHRRILEYPCLTPDPTQANAVYLPYYAGLDALRYLYGSAVNSSAEHGLDLFDYLHQDSPHVWNKNSGHDHFLVMARPAWDFTQPPQNDPPIWGTSFLEIREFFNVTALTLESSANPWQEHAIPYPTSFHPSNLPALESWLGRVRRSRRTTLILFAGGGGISPAPNVRHIIRIECENRTRAVCEIIDCGEGVCDHDPARYMKPMLRASFCLQPPGETPTRRSTFDAIMAGCVPVFFEDMSAKLQYGWHLAAEDYRKFSVLIPKEEVVGKGLRIVDVLMGISEGEIRRMREKVIEMVPRVLYRRHGSSVGLRGRTDAFDLAVEGTIQRIKGRLAGGVG